MNVVFLTNTFTPHVGGVARSVEAFTREYRKRGHRVMVVCPEFDNAPKREQDVVRVLAIQNFNASDFSVALPIPSDVLDKVAAFKADIIHSHHPFLLGMTAIRLARALSLPLVFTHHTLYEQYTHYVPGHSVIMQRFVIELATRYANLANQVFAPSESIRSLLLERGVTTPIMVVPTGVQVEKFSSGQGATFRERFGIDPHVPVIGHMGRLAKEKNLQFLCRSVIKYLRQDPKAVFLVIGSGPSEADIMHIFEQEHLDDRLILAGVQQGQALADGLNAMDVFVFSSKSETQGMVLTEAMACGLPVIALDAPGAREVVKDKVNGRLLQNEDENEFFAALQWVLQATDNNRLSLVESARSTADLFSLQQSANKALGCYESLKNRSFYRHTVEEESWEFVMSRIKTEWDILKSFASAGDEALSDKRL